MFQRALICTDFTDGIQRLAKFAPSLAAGGFQSLTFFHNVAVDTEREIPHIDPEVVAERKQRILDLLRGVPDTVEVSVDVQTGRASDNILKLAKKCQADVIFLGSPTRTMLEEKLFGSTTSWLSEKTQVPMLILRPQLISTYTTEELELRCNHLFRYLLIPYDGTQGGKNIINYIRNQVSNNPASVLERVRLLWVIDENIRRELQGDHPVAQAEEDLAQVQSELADLGLVVNTSVVEGDPMEQIMAAAEAHDIGAIAACSRGTSGLMKWSTPSFAREILRRSWHPVLFFPS